MYHIFSIDSPVRAKHVRADEYRFPVIALFSGNNRLITDDDSNSVEIDVTRSDKNGHQSSNNSENHPDTLAAVSLTYISVAVVPSTFSVTGSD